MRRKGVCKVLIMISVLSLFSFSLLAYNPLLWAQDIGITDSSIKIGVFGTLTGPAGPVSATANPVHGLITGYNEINKAGGIHGRKLEPIVIDDLGSPEGAKSAVKKLIYSEKVFCIHGGTSSLPTFGARQEVINAKIPFVLVAATMDKIADPMNHYIFSPCLMASADGILMVEFLMSKPGTKRLALVAHDNEWAKSKMAKGLPLLKEKYGLDLVARESLIFGATDATAQILRIKEANPDGVFVVLYPAEAAIFCRDAYKYGLKVPFVGSSVTCDLYELRDRVGRVEPMMNFFSVTIQKDALSAFGDIGKIHSIYFPADKFNSNMLWGIGGARVIEEALKRAGRNLTRERLIESLETIRDFDTGIFAGRITFTKDSHIGFNTTKLVTMVNGTEYYMEPKWIEGLKRWD